SSVGPVQGTSLEPGTWRPLEAAHLSTGGLVVSANLPASPQGPDHLFFFPRIRKEGRRMVSEDSQNHGWLPMIHRLGDARDLHQSGDCEMAAVAHELDDVGELAKVSRPSLFEAGTARRTGRLSPVNRRCAARNTGRDPPDGSRAFGCGTPSPHRRTAPAPRG